MEYQGRKKGKTTNALEKITREYMYGEGDLTTSVQELKDYHNSILTDLFPDQGNGVYNEVNNVMVEMRIATVILIRVVAIVFGPIAEMPSWIVRRSAIKLA